MDNGNKKFEKVIKLRGHHLICLNFFSGEGYDEDFVKNLEQIVNELRSGAIFQIIYGGDDICYRCPNLRSNNCYYKEDSDEGILKMDMVALDLLKVRIGQILRWDEVEFGVPKILEKWKLLFCKVCEWRYVCEKRDEFKSILLGSDSGEIGYSK